MSELDTDFQCTECGGLGYDTSHYVSECCEVEYEELEVTEDE